MVGDGSALYAPQALWSAVRSGWPITFVIVDNARYAILDAAARFAGLEDIPGLELPGIDFVSLAASLGCPADRVTAPGELGDTLVPGARRRPLRGCSTSRSTRRRRRCCRPSLRTSWSAHESRARTPGPGRDRPDARRSGRDRQPLRRHARRDRPPATTCSGASARSGWTTSGSSRSSTWPTSEARASCVASGPGLDFDCHPLQYTAVGEAAGEAIYLGDAGGGRLRADRCPRGRSGREGRGRPQHVPVRPGDDPRRARDRRTRAHL